MVLILGNIAAARYNEGIIQLFETLLDDELQGGYFRLNGATPHCTILDTPKQCYLLIGSSIEI
jgi:hypothetical protein